MVGEVNNSLSDDYGYSANNYSILERLDQCISTGSGYMGGTISVGFFDQTANDNLVKIIIKAINKRKDTEYLDKINDNIGEAAQAYKSGALDNKKFFSKVFDDLANKLNNDKKGIFSGLFDTWTKFQKRFPAWAKGIELAVDVTKLFSKEGQKSVATFMDLNKSGIALGEKIHNLHDYAIKAGIAHDDFVKILTKNSKDYVKLTAAFDNGTEVFSKLTNTANHLQGKGIDFQQGLDAQLGYVRRSISYFDSMGYSVDRLNFESGKYSLMLKKLSQMTGQQVSTIEDAIKQQEQDNLMKRLARDPENQRKMAVYTALGIPQAVQIARLTGINSPESAQWSLPHVNKEVLEFAETYLSNINLEEFSKYQNAETEKEKLEILEKNKNQNFEGIKNAWEELLRRNALEIEHYQQIPLALMYGNKDNMVGKGWNTAADTPYLLNFKQNAESDEEGNKRQVEFNIAMQQVKSQLEQLVSIDINSFAIEFESATMLLKSANTQLQKLNDIKNGNVDKNSKASWISKTIDFLNQSAVGTGIGVLGTYLFGKKTLSLAWNTGKWGVGKIFGKNNAKPITKKATKEVGEEVAEKAAKKATKEVGEEVAEKAAEKAAKKATKKVASKFVPWIAAADLMKDGANSAIDIYKKRSINEVGKDYEKEAYESSVAENLVNLLNPMKFTFNIEALADKGMRAWENHKKEAEVENNDISQLNQEQNKNLAEKMDLVNSDMKDVKNKIETQNLPNGMKIMTLDNLSTEAKTQLSEALSSANVNINMHNLQELGLKEMSERLSEKLDDVCKSLGNVNNQLEYINKNNKEALSVQYEMTENAKEHYTQCVFNNMDNNTNDSGKSFW